MKNVIAATFLALGLLLVSGGCRTVYDLPGNDTEQALENEELAEAVRQRLLDEGLVDVHSLDVAVRDGVVTIFGSVPSEAVRARALLTVSRMDGVAEVRNKIRVW